MRRCGAGLAALAALSVAQRAQAQTDGHPLSGMGEELFRMSLWLLIAAILFAVTYRIVDIVIPGNLKEQLAEGNTALAVFAGALFISAAIIIAALIH